MKRTIFGCTLLVLVALGLGFLFWSALEAEQASIASRQAAIREIYRQPDTQFTFESYLNDMNIVKVTVYVKIDKKYSYSYDLEAKDVESYVKSAGKMALVHFDTKGIMTNKAVYESKFVDKLNERLDYHGWQVEEAKLISIETTVK